MSPLEQLKVIKTEYFDIIFPEESSQSAFYLAERIDELYEKATSLLNEEKKLHLPVVICPCTQDCNAHYSPFPYAHICLYDTITTYTSELENMRETMIEIFYHELIHAISLNIRSESTEKVSKILFGDFYSIPNILMNTSWTEGITVSMESKDGFGRMNNGMVLNYLVQAKIENKFPNYYEIAGARDIYPKGTYSYYFGGAFSKYLQEKYGMEKYNQIWHQEKNLFKKAFKTTYDISLPEEWKIFEDSIPLPFLENTDIEYISTETMPSCLQNTIKNNQFYYVFYDSRKSGVFYFTKNQDINLKNSFTKPKKLFTANTAIEDLAFSQDGKYLLVTEYLPDNSETLCIRIFDIDKKRFLNKKISYSLLPAVFMSQNTNYLAAIEMKSTDTSLSIYNFDELVHNTNKKIEKSLIKKIPLKHFSEIKELCETENGFAYLMRNEGKWYLTTADTTNGIEKIEYTSFAFPNNILPYGLNYDKSSSQSMNFLLSTTGTAFTAENDDLPAAMPRLTKITVTQDKNATMVFQQKDISGGIISPVFGDDSYTFISKKTEWKDLATLKDSIPGGFSKEYTLPDSTIDIFNYKEKTLAENLTVTKYKSINYLTKGSFLPISISSFSFYPVQLNLLYTPLILGITYFTGSPAENFLTSISTGYDSETKSFASNYSLITGNSNLTFGLSSGINISTSGFDFFYYENVFGGTIPFITTNLFFQYQINSFLSYSSDFLFNTTNKVLAGIGYSLKLNQNRYDYFNFSLSTLWTDSFDFNSKGIFNITDDNNPVYGNIGFGFNTHLPQLLPIKNPWGITINLPTQIKVSIIPSNNTILSASATSIIFGKEIQKQTPNAWLYFTNFVFTAGYSIKWTDKLSSLSILKVSDLFANLDNYKQQQGITAGFHLYSSPMLGVLSQLAFDLSIDFKWFIKNTVNNKPYEITFLGDFSF